MSNASQSKSLRNRVLVAGILCQFCAGMLYSWSLYVLPIIDMFGWERSSVTLTFSIATFLVPIVMIFAGKWLPKLGATKSVLIGAGFLSCGMVISSFATSLPMLYLGYGMFGGIGVGFIYGVVNTTCAKWFPDKKGTVTGLTVAGFGLGSVFFSPICSQLIGQFGPMTTFLIQAGVTAVIMLIASPMMKEAPDGYTPDGWTPPTGTKNSTKDYTSKEMLGQPQYWFLLIMYLFANIAGLFTIGNAGPISEQVANLSPTDAALIVSVLSIMNTAGRFVGGALSDKFGSARVVTILYIFNTALSASLMMNLMTSFATIAIAVGGLAICFGGMMGAYPSLILDRFGSKYFGTNYAFIFLAYGFGGLLTTPILQISGGVYSVAFTIIGVACAIGFVMSLLLGKIKR